MGFKLAWPDLTDVLFVTFVFLFFVLLVWWNRPPDRCQSDWPVCTKDLDPIEPKPVTVHFI